MRQDANASITGVPLDQPRTPPDEEQNNARKRPDCPTHKTIRKPAVAWTRLLSWNGCISEPVPVEDMPAPPGVAQELAAGDGGNAPECDEGGFSLKPAAGRWRRRSALRIEQHR
jgi:hypothetical protein